eukprot:Sspe_Gene.107068::Locus_85137_Transcript_1_1_Confidence_1.000_Length_474::g.107068::m.107068
MLNPAPVVGEWRQHCSLPSWENNLPLLRGKEQIGHVPVSLLPHAIPQPFMTLPSGGPPTYNTHTHLHAETPEPFLLPPPPPPSPLPSCGSTTLLKTTKGGRQNKKETGGYDTVV